MQSLQYKQIKPAHFSRLGRNPRTAAVLLAAVAAIAPAAHVLGDATLVHQYSFNDNPGVNGAATDTVGTAHGTLVNGANDTGGALVTAGGGSGSAATSPAASLPSAAISGLTTDF